MPGFDRVLFVTAAPVESAAVLRGLGDGDAGLARWRPRWVTARAGVVETGVGKANAAAGTAAALCGVPPRAGSTAVVNIGVAGTLSDAVPLGASVFATRSVFADEGVQTPEGFLSCTAIGFPAGVRGGDAAEPDERLRERLADLAEHRGVIATVSTCSGVDSVRDAVLARTGAVAEGMEGAAVGVAAAGLGFAFAEVRVISNTTGDRGRQAWRMAEALRGIEALAARIVEGAS